MTRTEFPIEVRLRIIDRAHDAHGVIHCEKCDEPVMRGGYQIDHVVSEGIAHRRRALTPKDGQLLCIDCHKDKTARDAEALSKAKRLAEKQPWLTGQSEIARRYAVKQEDPDD